MPTTRYVRLLALIAALFNTTVFAAEKTDVDNGKTIFGQLCGICHAVSQDGSGPTMGPNLFGLYSISTTISGGIGNQHLNAFSVAAQCWLLNTIRLKVVAYHKLDSVRQFLLFH